MLAAWLALPDGARAQGAERGLQLIATTEPDPAGVLSGLLAWHPGRRDRVSLAAGGGVSDGGAIGRGEALWQFRLEPEAERGVGLYLGGGVAGTVGDGPRGWIVVTAGLETKPGGAGGWAFEVGLGGGLRLAAGYRWR